ncbi:MAG: AAA family ATPase [Acidobacteriia bacterium]|nr:AAA family ATPase [Terriglobia bacterium]
MYKSHFGLKTNPFNLTADPSFLYLSSDHREALAGLLYSIFARKGFVVLASEAGMGKTTLLGAMLQRFQGQICSSLILNPALTPNEFLEIALMDFGIADIPASKALRLNLLQQMLLRTQHEGKIAVLLIDEAHKLSSEVLEEIRLLSNFEMADQKLLQIVLCGQKELAATLDRSELWQLKQRVAFRMTIKPLAVADVEQYIQHRWKKAGGSLPTAFGEDALEQIAVSSKGIPRVINVICDNALTVGFADGTHVITANHIVKVCAELHLNGNDVRPPRSLADFTAGPRQVAAPTAAPFVTPAYSGPLRTLDRYDATNKRPSRWSRWFKKPMINVATTENV